MYFHLSHYVGYIKPVYKYVKKKPTLASLQAPEEEKTFFSKWKILERDLIVATEYLIHLS